MELTIEIVAAGAAKPRAGAPVIVQIRDAGLQDAAATTLAEARVTAGGGEVVARAQIECDAQHGYPIVWVHVDVDEDGRVSRGDFITTQSYPVREGGAMRVEVTRV
ncbi:MAG TPA: hypothetical protein VM733_12175 [Thermoanaerobaculia bacterium]|nr:hypothetical protein [Thermoanaerobaculia bacterium]